MPRWYDVSCPVCGAEWPGLEAGDSGLAPGEVRALSACGECFRVTTVTLRLTAEEVAAYRREILKTVQKMYQSYMKARARLEERRRVLAEQVRQGNTALVDTMTALGRRVDALRPPDTVHLDARARELEGLEAEAPADAGEVPCAECGTPTAIHREGHRGFDAPCPRCGSRLAVRLVSEHEASGEGREPT